MQTVFKPLVAVQNPVRYFLVLFVLFFGGFNLADTFRLLFADRHHTDLSNLLTLTLLLTVSVFVSRFLRHRKQQAA